MISLEKTVALWTPQTSKQYATPKAREDIHRIITEMGIRPIALDGKFMHNFVGEEYSAAIIQYPLKPFLDPGTSISDSYKIVSIIDRLKLAVIVHDIKSLQKKMFDKSVSSKVMTEIEKFENFIFSRADVLVVHSPAMGNYMADAFRLHNKRFIFLDMFDYLGHIDAHAFGNGVAFAGYLGPSKKSNIAALYGDLPIGRFSYNFYGPDFENTNAPREDIIYRGSFLPEILPQILRSENQCGLVWDSMTPEQRVYYGLIVPHKAALYIRAGLPMVVPGNTNIERFVLEQGIGVSIRKLSDFEGIPSHDKMSLESLQQKVGDGYFTKKAINSVIEAL